MCSKCKEATGVNGLVSQSVGCNLQKRTGPVPPGMQTPLPSSPLLACAAKRTRGGFKFGVKLKSCVFLPWISVLRKPQTDSSKQKSYPGGWGKGQRGVGAGKGLLLRGGRRAPPCLPAPVPLVWGLEAAHHGQQLAGQMGLQQLRELRAGGMKARRRALPSVPRQRRLVWAGGEHLVSMWHLAAEFASLAFPLVKGRAKQFASKQLLCSAGREQHHPSPCPSPSAGCYSTAPKLTSPGKHPLPSFTVSFFYYWEKKNSLHHLL